MRRQLTPAAAAEGGRAVVSIGFNDVGRWRPTGPGGYCLRWNKAPMDERCAYLTRRENKLAIRQANGAVASIERVEWGDFARNSALKKF